MAKLSGKEGKEGAAAEQARTALAGVVEELRRALAESARVSVRRDAAADVAHELGPRLQLLVARVAALEVPAERKAPKAAPQMQRGPQDAEVAASDASPDKIARRAELLRQHSALDAHLEDVISELRALHTELAIVQQHTVAAPP